MKKGLLKLWVGVLITFALVIFINPFVSHAEPEGGVPDTSDADLSENQTVELSVSNTKGKWIKVTAGIYGVHDFESIDAEESDPIVYVFALNEETTTYEEVDYFDDIDGDDSNFQFSYILNKDEVIYLYVENRSTSPVNTKVRCSYSDKDLRNMSNVQNNRIIKTQDLTKDDFIVFNDKNASFDMYYQDFYSGYGDNYDEGIPQNAGKYKIKVVGTDNYSGELVFVVQIAVAEDINNFYLNSVLNYLYDGNPFPTEAIRLVKDNNYLVQDIDFKISGYRVSEDKPWKSGMPAEKGAYQVKLYGLNPYYGTTIINIYILDLYELNNISYNDESAYNGTELGYDKLNLHINYFDKDLESYQKYLENGIDYTVVKYCGQDEGGYPDNKWISGSPKEKGDYYLHLEGKGSVTGSIDISFSIIEPSEEVKIDVNKISVTELRSSGITVNLIKDGYVYFKIRPSVTGEYNIFTKNQKNPKAGQDGESDYIYTDTYGTLYDSDGWKMVEDDDGGEENNFSITYKMEAKKVYYLAIRQFDFGSAITELNITGNGVTYKYYDDPAPTPEQNKPLAKGKKFKIGKDEYKVTVSKTGAAEVAYSKNLNKKAKSKTIKATVKYKGVTYKVTSISPKAFYKNQKLGKIIIKSKTIKKVGNNAVKGIKKKAVIKVQKASLKKYKKLFTKKTGFKKPMKITK